MSNSGNDCGSWINLPYCGKDRFAIKNEKKVSLEIFLDWAEEIKVSYNTLLNFKIEQDEILEDGPPCLNYILCSGIPKGTRNNTLFNIGVYLKKRYPDNYQEKLEEANYKYLSDPLSSTEVQGLIKSSKRKDYFYQCKSAPINAYCDVNKCRSKKYGISNDSYLPEFGELRKLEVSPPIWYLDVSIEEKTVTLELTTEELQQPFKFQKKCMELLHAMPSLPKQAEWSTIINKLFETMKVIAMPFGSDDRTRLIELLEKFCTGRAKAKNKDELLLGKPFDDGEFTYFRMSDFYDFLIRNNFNEYKINKVSGLIKNNKLLQASHGRSNIKGKNVNWYKINSFANISEELDIPKEIKDAKLPF